MFSIITPLLTFPFILYITPSPYLRLLSITGLLFFSGWSWLEREGHRIEREAEELRQLRSTVAGEHGLGDGDGGEGLPGKLKGAVTWRELLGEEEEEEGEEEEEEEELYDGESGEEE